MPVSVYGGNECVIQTVHNARFYVVFDELVCCRW